MINNYFSGLNIQLPKKQNIILDILLFLCVVLLGIYQYQFQYESHLNQDYEVFALRSDLMENYVQQMSSNNIAMKAIFESAYSAAEKGDIAYPEIDSMEYYPTYDVYALSPLENPTLKFLKGTITLSGQLVPDDPELQNQLNACLMIDSYFGAISTSLDEAIWSYYTSQQGFIYMNPAHTVSEFQFSNDLYDKEFWSEAAPENNPEMTQVITSLYDDAAGQGLMISISNPIVINQTFVGVISYDIGIRPMNKLLESGPSIGDTTLFDEKGLLVAQKDLTSAGKSIELPAQYAYDVWEDTNNDLVIVSTVVDSELFIMHTVNKYALRHATASSSALFWTLEVILAIMILLFFNNYQLAAERKELMLIDPLTNLYNRRGLKEMIHKFFSQSQRTNTTCAVFLVDIDHFKKVNDRYGHNCGDEVIKSVAKVLLKSNRAYSTVARWGGEEFLVFIPDIDETHVFSIAERFRTLVSSQSHCVKEVKVTISIGVYYNRVLDAPFEDMVIKADRALYHAKNTGRNRTVIFNASNLNK